MPVSPVFAMTPRQRAGGIMVGILIAAGLLLAIFVPRGSAGGLADQMRNGLGSLPSVASLIAGRSPGDRPEGALASLKAKKQVVLSEERSPRGLSAKPVSPLAALLLPSPSTPEILAPPVAPPVYALLASPPTLVPPTSLASGGSPGVGTPGIIVPAVGGGGGGGGGGGTTPVPVITQPTTPGTSTSAVPEPGSWTMMLVGFGLLGATLRRKRAAASQLAKA